MREVRFRGKINGSWIYTSANGEDFAENWAQFWATVHPATVGQWTGWQDKNGQDIYEDDIVLLEGTTAMGILFDNDCASFLLVNHEARYLMNDVANSMLTVAGDSWQF